MKCPCCGQPMGDVPDPLEIPMSPVSKTILRRLPATIEQLAATVYAHRANTPEWEHNTLRTTISRMRKIMAPYGWTIDNTKTGGWGAKNYHLVRLP